jgi:D-alanyl-D-alanine carboxypeptidase/D-alanyl-D-alanine-endopeptidase (penicillin-binding protein 4)
VSGRSGTLTTRLTDPLVAGKVHAKTGSTAVSGALSGYLTTASGRTAVFSIVVNQPRGAPEPAIDAFVTALAREL